jgi:hypothetical protein
MPAATFQIKVKKTQLLGVERESITIGRRSSCDFVLNDPMAADEHCRIGAGDEGFWIENLSTIGTFVSGVPVRARSALADGDEIVAGASRFTVAITPPRTLVLQLEQRSVAFVDKSGFDSESGQWVEGDPDRWVKTEVKLGRFPLLGWLNRLGLLAAFALIAITFAPRAQGPLFQPGPLVASHAALFSLPETPSARQKECAGAAAAGCQACHSPLASTPLDRCASCHQAMMRGQHPFNATGRVSDVDAERAHVRAGVWTGNACVPCHVDHSGGDALAAGFLPPVERVQIFCLRCHEGVPDTTRPLEIDRAARQLVYSSFRFGHRDHAQVTCVTCHQEATGAGALEREFAPVKFETCKRCHVDQDQSLAQWLPQKSEHRWRVAWHGTDDPANCLQCHTALFTKDLRTVTRPGIPASTVEFRTEALRSHHDEFAAKTDGRKCEDCHRRNKTLFAGDAHIAPFWHAVHVKTSLAGLAGAGALEVSKDCRACHTDRETSARLTAVADGFYRFESARCDDCHREGAFEKGTPILKVVAQPPPEPQRQTRTIKDFPHKDHLDFTKPKLADGCFTCHEFGAGTAHAQVKPMTKPIALDCASCHAGHDNIAGGDCQRCHPREGERGYNDFLGPSPSDGRKQPLRAWPEASGFRHFSRGHADDARGGKCDACHHLKGDDGILATANLKDVPIPDESPARYPECRRCHLEEKQRFHWR